MATGPLLPKGGPLQSVSTRQRKLLADAVGGLGFMSTATLTKMFSEAVLQGANTQSRQLIALADVFKRVTTDAGRRTAIHDRIAKLAQTSTVQAYGQLVTRREGPASRTHYRAGAGRFAGGKMLEALQAPGFVEAGPDGINFANTAVLDRVAAQWHRLNFGASGGKQGTVPATFEVRFNNLVVAALGFTEPPSPGFAMPRGVFTTPEGTQVSFSRSRVGQDLFTPGGGRRASRGPRQTAGIAAKNFLDAGLARIARELGPAYESYYAELWGEATAGKGPLADRALVRPTAIPTSVLRAIESD